jgi:uncharacterized repeat protein (TIGR01451 family)
MYRKIYNLQPRLLQQFSLILLFILIIMASLIFKSSNRLVSASGGDYKIIFSAADAKLNNGPYNPTYDRYRPAGLPCPAPSGGTGVASEPIKDAIYASPLPPHAVDSVTSLAPADMVLGQIVPFEIVINVDGDTLPENGIIQFQSFWSTETTSGRDFGYDESYGVYCAFVDKADSFLEDPGDDAKVDWYFSSTVGSEIQGEFQISGLDDEDKIVVEVWVVLDKKIPEDANGNVPAGMLGANTVADPPQVINTGTETVPLNKVGAFFTDDADLSITKIDIPNTPMIPLQEFDYEISVTNNTLDVTSNGVLVTDTLDDFVQFVSSSVEDPGGLGRNCTVPIVPYGGTVECDLVALGPLETVIINIRVFILEEAPVSSLIETGDCTFGEHEAFDLCNLVSVVTTVTQDDNPENNSDTEPKDVLPTADLGLVMFCPADPIAPPTANIVLDVENYGPQPAEGVVLTNTLAPEVTLNAYTSDLPSNHSTSGQDEIFELIDPLDFGITWETVLTIDVTNLVSDTPITIPNNAVVTATTPEPIDAVYANTDTCIITAASIEYFFARIENGSLIIDWMTSVEAGNLGFNLFTDNGNGRQKITEAMVPTDTLYSQDPRSYHYETALFSGGKIYVEELDVYHRSRIHGPFDLGKVYGEQIKTQPIDWKSIRDQQPSKADERNGTLIKEETITVSGNQTFLPMVTANANPNVNASIHFDPIDVLINETGLYRIAYEDLLTKGFDIGGVNSDEIALVSQGSSVPIRIVSQEQFGPGSYIEFVATAVDSLYTRTKVYTLINDDGKTRFVMNLPSAPISSLHEDFYQETISINKNIHYGMGAPTHDPWFEREVRSQEYPVSSEYKIPVDQLINVSAPKTLLVGLWGMTDDPSLIDHHVILKLNGVHIIDVRFDGIVYKEIKAPIAEGIIHDGENILEIILPGDTGADRVIAVDRYAITYPRAFFARDGLLSFNSAGNGFKVTNFPNDDIVTYRLDNKGLFFLDEARIEGDNSNFSIEFTGSGEPASYFVTASDSFLEVSEFRSAYSPVNIFDRQADFIIISHPDFISGLDALVKEREIEGLTVRIVNVYDIYALFNYQSIDPKAIRSFIKYAYEELGTKYILLVGDDTYDYFDYNQIGSISFIPSIYGSTHALVRHSPLDSLYADIDGDGVQDVAIGRFPVKSIEELEFMVAKTLSYKNKYSTSSVVFAADEEFGVISFKQQSDDLIQLFPKDWEISKAYIYDLGLENARDLLIDTINNGINFVNYYGHSSDLSWSFLDLFTINDAMGLTNFQNPTIYGEWGCWNTYSIVPNHKTLNDELLLSGSYGGAAVVGSVTLTGDEVHQLFSKQFVEELLKPGTRIGDAIKNTQKELSYFHPDIVDTFNVYMLLGDPTLVFIP